MFSSLIDGQFNKNWLLLDNLLHSIAVQVSIITKTEVGLRNVIDVSLSNVTCRFLTNKVLFFPDRYVFMLEKAK